MLAFCLRRLMLLVRFAPQMTVRSIVLIGAAVVAIGSSMWLLPGTLLPAADPATSGSTLDLTARPDKAPSRIARMSPPPAAAQPVRTNEDRFKLVGAVATGSAGAKPSSSMVNDIAFISVDGQPARAFRVGDTVEGDIVLSALTPNGATLMSQGGGGAMSVQIAAAPAEAIGSRPVQNDASVQPTAMARSMHSAAKPRSDDSEQTPPPPPSDLNDGRWTR